MVWDQHNPEAALNYKDDVSESECRFLSQSVSLYAGLDSRLSAETTGILSPYYS